MSHKRAVDVAQFVESDNNRGMPLGQIEIYGQSGSAKAFEVTTRKTNFGNILQCAKGNGKL